MKYLSFLLIFFYCNSLAAQKTYAAGDTIKDFEIKELLNSPVPTSSFYALKQEITILDFFATWCAPCIRSVPLLDEYKKQYGGRLSILFISVESTERLSKFIESRKPFPFAVIADKGGSISKDFAPPSFPYTLVINKQNKILAVTDAGSIKASQIEEWLDGKTQHGIPSKQETEKFPSINTIMNPISKSSNSYVAISQDLVYAAKSGEKTAILEDKLARLDYNTLLSGLENDNDKKAFWINLYNAYTQILLKKDPGAYKHRGRFFSSRKIVVAEKHFSLDDIEHGILRKSKIKWSLGYLGKPFPGKTEKELRVKHPDQRIHFALNCGARSCPPIAFYDPAKIDMQLDIAETAYLSGELTYDHENNRLKLPAIMGWFRRDFGGKKKMLLLAKRKGYITEDVNPTVRFNKYDWSLHLNNYQN